MSASAPPDIQPRLFSPKVVLALVLTAVFSASAFLALSAYAPDLRTGQDGGAHALSKSAIGYAGLARLLRDEGRTVLISRSPPGRSANGAALARSDPRGLLILTPKPGAAPKDLQAFNFRGWIMIVLPKWGGSPNPLRPGWVDKAGLFDPGAVAAPVTGLAKGAAIARRTGVTAPVLRLRTRRTPDGVDMRLSAVDRLQTISGPGLKPVLTDEAGRAVLARYGDSQIFILADPDLINTQGLASLDNARLAQAVIDAFGPGPVIFDVTLAGFTRGRSLLRLMLEPPLLGVVICLLAAAALMGLHAAARFGPPLVGGRALALGKLALADNSAGLIRMARREPRMAPGYAALVREGVARAVGVPRGLEAGEADAVLDRLGAARHVTTTWSELAAQAQAVNTNADLMRLARRLFDWRLEMMRERR